MFISDGVFLRESKQKERQRGRVGAASKRADKPNPARDKSTSEGKETKPSREKVTILRPKNFLRSTNLYIDPLIKFDGSQGTLKTLNLYRNIIPLKGKGI